MFQLLTRDQFRQAVFYRDNHQCLICSSPAQDAHHILERRLWPDGGYYLANGASLCGTHHLEAEATTLSCQELRDKIGLKKFPLPPQLEEGQDYDKWGNPLLPNGFRLPGELFYDESVQKILSPVLYLFTQQVKYPRTYHLPWSPGATQDDRILSSLRAFEGKEVVVTIKMDGENTTLYRDKLHARSLDYKPHPSRTWIRSLQARLSSDIPEGWRLCGENLFAQHSIIYQNLSDYFLLFSIWNNHNTCLSWSETQEWAQLLNLQTVPVLYEGIWDEDKIRQIYTPQYQGDACEGYVVRVRNQFSYKDFRTHVGKYVRSGHVQTGSHWMRETCQPNYLRKVVGNEE